MPAQQKTFHRLTILHIIHNKCSLTWSNPKQAVSHLCQSGREKKIGKKISYLQVFERLPLSFPLVLLAASLTLSHMEALPLCVGILLLLWTLQLPLLLLRTWLPEGYYLMFFRIADVVETSSPQSSCLSYLLQLFFLQLLA